VDESQYENDKILAFILAATSDPSLVEKYRKEGVDYLRKEWGFTEEDVESILRTDQPPTLAMTVWPQPPIVWPRPPTVWS
jgi:hypothetical protein